MIRASSLCFARIALLGSLEGNEKLSPSRTSLECVFKDSIFTSDVREVYRKVEVHTFKN